MKHIKTYEELSIGISNMINKIMMGDVEYLSTKNYKNNISFLIHVNYNKIKKNFTLTYISDKDEITTIQLSSYMLGEVFNNSEYYREATPEEIELIKTKIEANKYNL